MSTSMTDPMIGRLIDGRYQVRSRIARGGMATVYLATDQRLERLVAVKIMHGHLADDSTFTERFIQEARSAARLAHPNVVNVFDQGQDADSAYLVMEYLPGITLRDLLQEYGALTSEQTMDIVEALLSGLAAAHRAGIVHRDLKPENVLLADDGRIKIGDFGLARAATAATATGAALLGTIAYLSPELVTRGIADTRSDIYAVGIMMFEMLTGEQPFKGEQPMQIAYQHANDSVPAPSGTNPKVPAELDELVLWATARDPEDRPADARELLEQVQETARNLETSLTGTGPQKTMAFATPLVAQGDTAETQVLGTRGAVAAAVTPAASAMATSSATGELARAAAPRRRRGWILLAVVLLLAGLAAGAGWWFGAGPGAQATIEDVRGLSVEEAQLALEEQGVLVSETQGEAFDPEVPAGLVAGTDPPAGEIVARDLPVQLVVSLGREPTTVPGVIGIPEADARLALETARLVPAEQTIAQFDGEIPEGSVVALVSLAEDGTETAIEPESSSFVGTPVSLVVSAGPVPDVIGLPSADAIRAFEDRGLVASVVGEPVFNNDIAADGVVSVAGPEGAIRPGAEFALTLSKGPDLVDVPEVVGESINAARDILTEAGFEVTIETNAPSVFWGLAIVQEVRPGDAQVLRGTPITIVAFFD
ncbi:Stk1 family PASTA domain-containing Ser/Thr kinase [Microcella daejeonensis]|uniref:non-specific serine/threonine protein kinase n=1 Tax=Microcella daejeonensis TaxID=2994971 RepID=A0A9E8MMD9_9MICO|nr:Stk1 family PASTA domain-containing Ser/Thr kinase [Microcella daejeonensis]WAB81376.1 Stk1 family PASTA domain-containing Ser/Thr kinase [Microcella daejeonensis]